jgi:hypothetical protein
MKTNIGIALICLATILITSPIATASPAPQPVFMSIPSPDHPSTWVVGAHQKAKLLRWDASRRTLFADVKYSTEDYADNANPAQTDDHSLAFPSVCLAKNGVDLLASNRHGQTAAIGRIQNGLFGREVVLKKCVSLNVHRVEGRINASLVYDALDRR